MPSDTWDPAQYGRFATERAQPFWDLVELVEARLPGVPRRMFDLGCGPGDLTDAAARRLKVTEAVGVDSSAAMLDSASGHARQGLRFEHGDIGQWTSAGDVDLVVANASLQWVPDHPGVLDRWTRALAVQVPANADHPSHLVADEVGRLHPHLLDSSASVVDWMRGTALTRFFARLPEALHEPFVDAYRALLLGRIGQVKPYLFTFKRILLVGRRPV